MKHSTTTPPRTIADPPVKDDMVVVTGLLAGKYPGKGQVKLITAKRTFVKFPGQADLVSLPTAFLKKTS